MSATLTKIIHGQHFVDNDTIYQRRTEGRALIASRLKALFGQDILLNETSLPGTDYVLISGEVIIGAVSTTKGWLLTANTADLKLNPWAIAIATCHEQIYQWHIVNIAEDLFQLPKGSYLPFAAQPVLGQLDTFRSALVG